jgi:hypothetical protein
VLGGLSWERRPIDPVPGPRAVSEIDDAEELAPGILLAGPQTHVRGRSVYFAESRMAQFLGEPTVLIDVSDGPAAVAGGLAQAVERLRCDLVVFVDVGGDVVAHGDEPGLRSPLCDALTPDEVLARLSKVAEAGGLCGVRGLTSPVAERLEASIQLVPTEASAQAVRTFRGARGLAAIRGGARTLELTPIAASTVYLDVEAMMAATGRLAHAVDGAESLEDANDALHALGVRTELDLERDAGAAARA